MPEPTVPFDPITNLDDAPVDGLPLETQWSGTWKVLTPHMRAAGGTLGVVQNTLPPGAVGCPFHWHLREDEVFFIQSGRGVLRYGDTVRALRPGDCVSCPAGTQIAHQIGNPYDEDLVYLAIGPRDPHEVCGYPDSGKVLVRAMRTVGRLEPRAYHDDEPLPPLILALDPSREG